MTRTGRRTSPQRGENGAACAARCGPPGQGQVRRRTLGAASSSRGRGWRGQCRAPAPARRPRPPGPRVSGRCQTRAASEQDPQCCRQGAHARGAPSPHAGRSAAGGRMRREPLPGGADPRSAGRECAGARAPPLQGRAGPPPAPTPLPFQVTGPGRGLRGGGLPGAGLRAAPHCRWVTDFVCYCDKAQAPVPVPKPTV